MASPSALAYLGYRALVAHPLRKLFRRRGTGLERFRANYVSEGLGPTSPADRADALAAQACISCGLCEIGCNLAAANPQFRALGVHAVFRLYARNPVELPLAAPVLQGCASCAGCHALCPTGVPIDRLIASLSARVTGAPGAAS